jgi:hypothetical protein
MDPLTHFLITRKVISREARVLLAGLAPDAPFYLTYPIWLVKRGQFIGALLTNDWPPALRWMQTLHHLFHSLPVLFTVAGAMRLRTGRWPLEALAWGLHILVDLPTHSRRNWAPQFLWPLSTVTVDGISWPESITQIVNHIGHLLGGAARVVSLPTNPTDYP